MTANPIPEANRTRPASCSLMGILIVPVQGLIKCQKACQEACQKPVGSTLKPEWLVCVASDSVTRWNTPRDARIVSRVGYRFGQCQRRTLWPKKSPEIGSNPIP